MVPIGSIWLFAGEYDVTLADQVQLQQTSILHWNNDFVM